MSSLHTFCRDPHTLLYDYPFKLGVKEHRGDWPSMIFIFKNIAKKCLQHFKLLHENDFALESWV